MSENKKTRRKGPGALGIFFIVFFVLAGVILLGFCMDFFHLKAAPKTEYTIGDANYKLSADLALHGSERMICFDDIAGLCNMAQSGDAASRTFYTVAAGESVQFTADTVSASVNGTPVTMAARAHFAGDKVYVPLSFIKTYMTGLVITEEKNSVEVVREEYNASTKENPLYVDAAFTVKGEELSAQTGTVKEPESDAAPVYTFVADLSAYEPYMCPADPDAYLTLVNRTHLADAGMVPENLVDVVNSRSDRTERMVETAEKALEALYIEMRIAGYTDVSVTSGYRSYDKQDYLYRLYTENEMKNGGISKAEAEKIVDTYSARPGTSEHQTGLCCDMHNLPSADQSFAKKEAYTWLLENCYKFGFILRFPEGKEEITGYSFEPWHFRFVGRVHASKMHELGMCLEEYIEYLGM